MLAYMLLMSKDVNLRSRSILMSLRSVISCVGFFILNAYGSGMYRASFSVSSLAILYAGALVQFTTSLMGCHCL
jgi:hypothetical protein